ncbi:MAG: peptidase domain-containing ABC transporter [Saprospiraceae bacterium]
MLWNKYPFYHQNNLRDCGIACLRMIAAYYGKAISPQRLRKYAGMEKEGASLMGISRAAKAIGMTAEGVQLNSFSSFEQLKQALPSILYWNKNHFVVLFQISHGKYVVADPAKGIRRYNEAQIKQHVFFKEGQADKEEKAYALLLQPTAHFHQQISEKEVEQKKWGFLRDKLKELRLFFAIILLGILASTALQYVLPFMTKSVVDLGISSGDLRFITYLLIGQLVIILSKTFFNILRGWLVLHLSIRINYSLISNFLQKLFRLPLPFFETRKIGDILQRIRDHNRIEKFITQNLLTILISVLSILVYAVVLYLFNPIFFGLFFGATVIYFVWITFFLKARRNIDQERFGLLSKNQSILIQIISGMHDLKINNSEAYSFNKWKDNQVHTFKNTFKYLKVNQIQETGTILIIELTQLMILFMSANLIVNNEITLGTLLSIQFILGQLISPMEQLVNTVIFGQEAKISFDRIYEFWNEKDEQTYTGQQLLQIPMQQKPSITIRDLSFSHPGQHQHKTLKDISLEVPFGKTTAIVGTSGSGKTTLLKLLLGYYYDYQGDILMGDHNFKQLEIDAWRNQCGVIMQESYIFDDTIRSNITLSEEADPFKLAYACKIANIDTFINELPQAYDTVIGRDGKGLSMGQKQRLLIARAIYKDPDFIFMDEATNSLDADNEYTIMENLKAFFKGKTVIIIAHRLSTIQFADKIVVVDKGSIAEQGPHDYLISKKGRYYDLVKKQI